jgi:hypothetical protein
MTDAQLLELLQEAIKVSEQPEIRQASRFASFDDRPGLRVDFEDGAVCRLTSTSQLQRGR